MRALETIEIRIFRVGDDGLGNYRPPIFEEEILNFCAIYRDDAKDQ